MKTTPELFATSHGVPLNSGEHCCFFCGAPCDEQHTTKQHVAESFTERNEVAAPGSSFVCVGCVECMRGDRETVRMIDGEVKLPVDKGTGKAPRLLQTRWFGWWITEQEALAFTPGNRVEIESLLLQSNLPSCWALCIADGNKHQLYKTPLNHATDSLAVNCLGTLVRFGRDELQERLLLTLRMASIFGKGGDSFERLMSPLCDMGVALQASQSFDRWEDLCGEWRMVRNEPLTQLAWWITPGKEEASARLI